MGAGIATVLTKVKTAVSRRHATSAEMYETFVRTAAVGMADPDEVAAFLDASGFDADAFQADVERLTQRLDWARDLAAGPPATAKLAEAERKAADLNQRHAAEV
jgi:hypothetical protein